MQLPTASVKVNEVYTSCTIQGEGMDIGKPCIFIRLHHCPVKCSGCDTSFSWNGSESGEKMDVKGLEQRANGLLAGQHHHGCGVVVSGGEPLLYYRNTDFANMVGRWTSLGRWVGLETSGFVKPVGLDENERQHLRYFLSQFTSVHLSPKITPCLHGEGWTDEQLTRQVVDIFQWFADHSREKYVVSSERSRLALKFVVKDEADLTAVSDFLSPWRSFVKDYNVPVYVMPFGQERDEIIDRCEWLVPYLAKYGWILSPRLHSIIWGRLRGV